MIQSDPLPDTLTRVGSETPKMIAVPGDLLAKADRVLESCCAESRRLLARREAWLGLILELGWAVACSDSGGKEVLNAAAQGACEQMPLKKRERSIEGIRRHISRTAPADILIDFPGLLIWRASPTAAPPASRPSLSRREREVLAWLREGKNSEEIAVILGLSKRTIEKHLQNVYRKLGVANALQAILHSAV